MEATHAANLQFGYAGLYVLPHDLSV